MKVSLIVTTYNRPDALAAVLASVTRQRRIPDETIVVDDGSDDHTAAVLRHYRGVIPHLEHLWQEHDGFRPARMRNRGIARASGEYIVLIDGDMVLDPRFVGDHLRHAARGRFLQGIRIPLNESATAAYLQRPFRVLPWHVGGLPKVKYLIRSSLLARLAAPRPHGALTRIHSCNQSFWREDLLRVNGFDERYNGCTGEDFDLCGRLVEEGILQQRLRFVALAYHLYHAPQANWTHMARFARTSTWADLGVAQHLSHGRRAAA